MESSSDCEKNMDGSYGGKHKKITFEWKYLALKQVEKPLKRVGKTGAKIHLKSCLKQSIRAPIYRLGKTSRWGKTAAWTAVGRPARSTANGQKSDRWSLGRPARSTVAETESRALCRSTDPVDRGFPESRALWTVDRPSSQTWRARLCTSVDRQSQKQGLWVLKT